MRGENSAGGVIELLVVVILDTPDGTSKLRGHVDK
jgi:hypothetical protein